MPAKRSKKKSPGLRGKPMKSGVRSPSAHRTLEQAQASGAKGGYGASADQVKKRSMRNQARAQKVAEVGKKAMKGKDAHHENPIRSGGGNSKGNVKVASRKANRGWRSKA